MIAVRSKDRSLKGVDGLKGDWGPGARCLGQEHCLRGLCRSCGCGVKEIVEMSATDSEIIEELRGSLKVTRGGVTLPRAIIELLPPYLVSTLKMTSWTEVEGMSFDGFVECLTECEAYDDETVPEPILSSRLDQ